jgi:hypothetical protein
MAKKSVLQKARKKFEEGDIEESMLGSGNGNLELELLKFVPKKLHKILNTIIHNWKLPPRIHTPLTLSGAAHFKDKQLQSLGA